MDQIYIQCRAIYILDRLAISSQVTDQVGVYYKTRIFLVNEVISEQIFVKSNHYQIHRLNHFLFEIFDGKKQFETSVKINIVVWSPKKEKNIGLIEKVQSRATEIPYSLRNLRYEARLTKWGMKIGV